MIRVVSIAALLSLLVLVLYLPSAHPPERFLAHIRSEHQAMAELWGETPALRILDRALGLQGSAREATLVAPTTGASDAIALDSAGSREMAAVSQRLFGNSYFRSIDALLLLAAFRLSAMLEWLPWMAAFVAAAMADGFTSRAIKSKEFLNHDPERFALCALLAIALTLFTVTAMMAPFGVHPMITPCVFVVLAMLCALSVANFHRLA